MIQIDQFSQSGRLEGPIRCVDNVADGDVDHQGLDVRFLPPANGTSHSYKMD